MKKTGTVLDMGHDKAMMFNMPVQFEITRAGGRYCVNIMDSKSENLKKQVMVLTATEHSIPEEKNESKKEDEDQFENTDEILIISEKLSPAAKRKMLLKLHKQYGHASADSLQKLLKSSGNNDIECIVILEKIVSECEICQRYSKPKPKPAVGLPLASQYNETMPVDLNQ